MKNIKINKLIYCMCMVFLISINCFATSINNNDGSAFITKAEFDALKSNFQSQIDTYNSSIDSKIDEAISAYLKGISVTTTREIKLDVNQNLEFPVYSCVGKESSKHSYKENGDARYDLSLPHIEIQTSGITSSNNSTSSNDKGLRIFTGHTTDLSYNDSTTAIIDLVLTTYHTDPRTGNYESVAYDTSSNKWRTKGYKNGYIKSGSEYKVQDLTISRGSNNLMRSGVYNPIDSNWSTNYFVYVYLNALGSNANMLYNTSDATTFTKWYGDTAWKSAQANWFNFNNIGAPAAKTNYINNFTGKNITLADLKKAYTDAGFTFWTDTSKACTNSLPASDVKERIETDRKRNKIYSGSDAYVNAYPESSIWCYNPTKIGGSWKSDDYALTYKYRNIFYTSNYTKTNGGKGVMPYDPHFPFWIPALDGDTSDETFAKTAKFSIIKADKLYWTDDNGDDHKFNEGLFITKLIQDASLSGEFKFSESSDEKVWCAFSTKPFDGSWTEADALPVTIRIGDVKQTITNFLYECGKDYSFTIDDLKKDDKVYMCFKSSGGNKNPSLDYLNKLQTKSVQ